MDFKTTAELPVGKNIVNRIIGQNVAVSLIKKAAKQGRHVLLIGEPGTGKSMLGQALAELLPIQKLSDVLVLPNFKNENEPIIKTVSSGKGRDMLEKAKLRNLGRSRNKNIILFILAIFAMIFPWWIRSIYGDIMAAASLLAGMVFVLALVISMSIGSRKSQIIEPKLLVDSSESKKAPFIDATGAHAGALLGDVRHDPFQCFSGNGKVTIVTAIGLYNKSLRSEINKLFSKYSGKIIKGKENNYEAIHLPKNKISVLGVVDGIISPVNVLSSNRHDYEGELIKLTTSEGKELIVTPEHKIATWKNGKIIYKKAGDIKVSDEIISHENYHK